MAKRESSRKPGRKMLRATAHVIEAMEQRLLLSKPTPFAPGGNAPELYQFYHIVYNAGKSSPSSPSRSFGISPSDLPAATGPVGLFPEQIRAAYGIDKILWDGTGQTVAIVDAFDNPAFVSSTDPNFLNSDLHLFDVQFGLPDPPSFLKLDQNGGTNYPAADTTGWAGEIALDVEWVHAIAPGANIVLIEANTNDDSDLVSVAVNTARNLPGVSAVSMSFGRSEDSSDLAINPTFTTPPNHTGVTFLASTGDGGSPGGYPAYSPNVVAVGGTTLMLSNGLYGSETAWSGSGGGQSIIEGEPSYQAGVQSSGWRQIPDVAFDADPNSGVAVYDSYEGGTSPWFSFGGTSVSAPCWAGLIAITNQLRAVAGLSPLDGPNGTLPTLYSLASNQFHDITTGSNGGFSAGVGYDKVTGRGTPVADLLVPGLANIGPVPPVAAIDAYQTPIDVQLTVAAPGVLANDTDANGDSLTAVLVASPAHGSLALNANGSFVYTPDAGFSGDDSFTYLANDGTFNSALPAQVSILVGATRPANDLFANRATITGMSATITGSNVNATKETGEPNHAGRSGGQSVWWSWTPPVAGNVTIDTLGSDFDTVLAVYTGRSVSWLTEVASNDDAIGLTSRVSFYAYAGMTYQIAVDGYGGSTGTINLDLALVPGNDNFAGRFTITGTSATITGSNENATKEPGEPNHAGVPGGRSVWWSWTAPITGNAAIDTFGSNFDTVLAVYTGSSVSALTVIAGNDDSPIAGHGVTSSVAFSAVAGMVYQIAVDGSNGASGTIGLDLLLTPGNDNFADAYTISGTSAAITGSNVGATKETGEPNHAGITGGHSVWWTWTAPTPGTTVIDTSGSNFDTVLAVYTGSTVSSLTEVASNDDYGLSLTSLVTFYAFAGTTYQIAVDGYGGATGTIHLNLLDTPGPAIPGNVLASDNLTDRVRVTWSAAYGATAYDVWRNTSSDSSTATRINAADITDTSYDDLSAAPGVPYWYWVTARNADGTSPFGNSDRGHVYSVPANDAFANRIAISSMPATVTGSTLDATRETGEPNHAGVPGGHSIWWTWTAPISFTVSIDTLGSNFDTLLAVYTGSAVSALTVVASNDDASGATSRVTFNAVAGRAYQIAVDGFEGDSGTVVLSVRPVPTNDNFANALTITGASATVTGSNLGATYETGEPNHAGITSLHSVWWIWTAPTSGNATIDTWGSNFDTVLAVYTGTSVSSLTAVASNDDSPIAGRGFTSSVVFPAVSGTAYRIAVDGYFGDVGSIVLNVGGAATPVTISGTIGDDQIYVKNDAGTLKWWTLAAAAPMPNPATDTPAGTRPLALITTLAIQGRGGNDRTILDLSGGILSDAAVGGVSVDGGAGTDYLLFKGVSGAVDLSALPAVVGPEHITSIAGVENVGFADGSVNLAGLPGVVGLVSQGTASVTLAKSMTVSRLEISGTGKVSLAPGGGNTLVISTGTSSSINFTLPPDTSPAQPFVGLDLNDNGMVLKAGDLASRDALLTTLSGLIQRSRNAFASANVLWAGNGIRSSTVAAEATGDTINHIGLTGVVIAPNATFNTTTGAETGLLHDTWKGQSGLDENAILLGYSFNGDANWDGNITFDDYAQANYGFLHGKGDYWWGNFDYSIPVAPATAYVTFDDYFMMNQAFLNKGTHVPNPIPMAKVAGPFSTKVVARPKGKAVTAAQRIAGTVKKHRGRASR